MCHPTKHTCHYSKCYATVIYRFFKLSCNGSLQRSKSTKPKGFFSVVFSFTYALRNLFRGCASFTLLFRPARDRHRDDEYLYKYMALLLQKQKIENENGEVVFEEICSSWITFASDHQAVPTFKHNVKVNKPVSRPKNNSIGKRNPKILSKSKF